MGVGFGERMNLDVLIELVCDVTTGCNLVTKGYKGVAKHPLPHDLISSLRTLQHGCMHLTEALQGFVNALAEKEVLEGPRISHVDSKGGYNRGVVRREGARNTDSPLPLVPAVDSACAPLTECAKCGGPIPPPTTGGNKALYCSEHCRKLANREYMRDYQRERRKAQKDLTSKGSSPIS